MSTLSPQVSDATLSLAFEELRRLAGDPGMMVGLVNSLEALLTTKGEDYSGDQHTYWSFEAAAEVAHDNPFNAFAILIGTKVSRLLQVTRGHFVPVLVDPEKGPVLGNVRYEFRSPNHESAGDTWMDLAGYSILLYGYALALQSLQTGEVGE